MLREILIFFWVFIILIFIARLIKGVYFYTLLKTKAWDFITWDVYIYYHWVKPYRNDLINLLVSIIFNVLSIFLIFGIEPFNKWIAIDPENQIPILILILFSGWGGGFLIYFKILYSEKCLQNRLRHYLIKNKSQ